MTFSELQISVYRQCGYEDTPNAKVAARVKEWINRGHRACLRLPGMTELRRKTLQFNSVAGQTLYTFGLAFERIDAMMQQSNNVRLTDMDRDTYRLIDPGETAAGNPVAYVSEGWQPRYKPPDAAATPVSGGTGIWVVSSSAADTTQTVKMRGIRRSGDPQAMQSVVLTGATRVQLGLNTDYSEILSWDISAVAAGEVSLYNAAVAGSELARIPIGATSVQYWCLRLWPTPSAALTYTVDGQVELNDMVEDNAVPLLPPSYHDILAAYARSCEYERTNDPRFKAAQLEWLTGIGNLKMFVNFPPDYRPVAGSLSNGFGFSDLPGGWYPADRGWP